MSAIVRVFNLFPRYSYEVGVLCDTVEQGQEFVNWNSGQIAREMEGEYLGSDVEHQDEYDDGYAADYDATKPLEENGLSYSELLKIARDHVTDLLRSALWELCFGDQDEDDVRGVIEMRSKDCQKLGVDPVVVTADFDEEWDTAIDEDDESEDEE